MLVLALCVLIAASSISWILGSLAVAISGISLAAILFVIAIVKPEIPMRPLSRIIEDKSIYEVFRDKLLPLSELKPYDLPNLGDGVCTTPAWRIGLFSVDSNAKADAWDAGLCSVAPFSADSAGDPGADFDLCIFLVHHHLLPIRSLEADRQNTWNDLLNVTSMVNSGSLLETLSEARVDLVLHGHEHAHNFAAYQSLQPATGLVQVLAAGSATGNRTLEGARRAMQRLIC